MTTAYYTWWLPCGLDPANCVAAYKPKDGINYAYSKVNLADPGTYDAVNGVAYPTWAAGTAWSFVGASSQYLDTGIVPLATNWSYVCRFANSTLANAGYVFGQGDIMGVGALMGILPTADVNGAMYYGNNLIVNQTLPQLATGVLGMADRKCYRNGVADGIVAAAEIAIPNFPIHIGCLNDGGAPSNFITADILALAIYNVTLNDAQMLAVSTAMAAL